MEVNIRRLIRLYGEPYIINSNWKYHACVCDVDKMVNIFNMGILSKKELFLHGLRKINTYDRESQNGFENISLAIKSPQKRNSAYRTFCRNYDAAIISEELPVIQYKDSYKRPVHGLKRLIIKEEVVNVPISTFDDEVQVWQCVPKEYIIGMKIGFFPKSTINIISRLLQEGKDIMLYDVDNNRRILSSELVKRLSL